MRRGLWGRLPVLVAGFLVIVAVGGFGSMLFWSVGFVAWACVCLGAGVLNEIWLRRRERSRGWDELDRPALMRPVEGSVAIVVASALVGTDNTHLTSLAIGSAVFILTFPTAWRTRRRRRARERADLGEDAG